MLSWFRGPLLAIAIVACGREAVPTAVNPPTAADHLSASATWFAADAFTNGQLTIDVPTAPSGRTMLFLVPASDSRDWRKNDPSVTTKTEIALDVKPIEKADAIPGKPLPSIKEIEAKTLESPRPTPASPNALPEERTFRVWSQVDKKYVAVAAKRASVGAHYAFYEDVTNRDAFTPDEYATMHSVLDRSLPAAVRTFGEPTDVDGNGHIVVLLSRIAGEKHPSGEAHVDMCTLTPAISASCSGQGEVLFVWSLDRLLERSSQRAYWASEWFPRTIVHETIHLLQYAAGFRRSGHVEPGTAPAYLREGAAEVMRYVTGLGAEEGWKRIAESVARPETTPFEEPYFLGGLHAYFLERRFGSGVEQRLSDAFLGPKDDRDLVSDAIGVDEPLALAWMWAAIVFDETAFGAASKLEFPGEDLRKRNLPLSPIAVRAGRDARASIGYTGRAIFAVEHDKPVRMTVNVTRGRAPIVLLARP